MRKIFLASVFILSLLLACYLIIPPPNFPKPPENSLQSNEPGDMESIYRRAYFTQGSRSEILDHYSMQFGRSGFFSLPLLQFLLNYPPEESFTLIRDQTKSSWLQELVHPGRESLYVNGFYPTKPTEQINIDGVHYVNKITVRYVPSHWATRLTSLVLVSLCIYLLSKEYAQIK